ncbi:MAG: methylated-DNA--[protein]-cysteine S-methyltransferase [Paramuribaculum sp.]|nr:methylated-DNA--[protein]-cysteine S-methyltransferase [Paramuribaculum sp.]
MKPYILETPAGTLAIAARNRKLILCDWVDSPHYPSHIRKIGSDENNEEYVRLVAAQILEYFSGNRKDFDIDAEPVGTPFQQRVWKELSTIGYGETVSYSDLALRIGSPKAARSVAGAIARNPVSIIIPCHRVIGSDGSLTGYAGGIEAKRILLTLEKSHLRLSKYYSLKGIGTIQ